MTERALVTIATYNEGPNLVSFIEEVLLVGDLLGEPTVNALIVDDHSSDGTGSRAEALRGEHRGRVDVLHRVERAGLGAALVAGFRYALASQYDFIIQMDRKSAYDPSMLPRLLRAAHQHDLVLVSRYLTQGLPEPLWHRISGQLARQYALLALGESISDPTTGFKCFRRAALANLNLNGLRSDGRTFQLELLYRCIRSGMSIGEVPLHVPSLHTGEISLNSIREALHFMWLLKGTGWAMEGLKRVDRQMAAQQAPMTGGRPSKPRR